MDQVLEFTSIAEVKKKEYRKTAGVTFYVATLPPLKISQTIIPGCCRRKTIFKITILNTSDHELKEVTLIDYIYTNAPFCIPSIKMATGYYQFYSDSLSFHIPLLKGNEEFSIDLAICSHPCTEIINCIEPINYSRY